MLTERIIKAYHLLGEDYVSKQHADILKEFETIFLNVKCVRIGNPNEADKVRLHYWYNYELNGKVMFKFISYFKQAYEFRRLLHIFKKHNYTYKNKTKIIHFLLIRHFNLNIKKMELF